MIGGWISARSQERTRQMCARLCIQQNLAHRAKNAAELTPYQVEQRDETMLTEARPNENCKEPASKALRLFIKCAIKRSQP